MGRYSIDKMHNPEMFYCELAIVILHLIRWLSAYLIKQNGMNEIRK